MQEILKRRGIADQCFPIWLLRVFKYRNSVLPSRHKGLTRKDNQQL